MDRAAYSFLLALMTLFTWSLRKLPMVLAASGIAGDNSARVAAHTTCPRIVNAAASNEELRTAMGYCGRPMSPVSTDVSCSIATMTACGVRGAGLWVHVAKERKGT